MDKDLSSIMAGAPFRTAQSTARVVRRVPHGSTGEDDVLLVQVESSARGGPLRAWTTLPAMALAFETGCWTRCPSPPSAV